MSKIFGFLLLFILVGALGYGGFWMYQRYLNTGRHVAVMTENMSNIETAHVRMLFERYESSDLFVFGDVTLEGDIDFRESPVVAYDVAIDVATTPLSGGEHARVSARQVSGKSYLRFESGPTSFLLSLEKRGVVVGDWVLLDDSSQVLELLGESFQILLETQQKQSQFRELLRTTDWFVDPKATLTEIVRGRVTRIYTAELNPDSINQFEEALYGLRYGRAPSDIEKEIMIARKDIWENSRVNMWIDQQDKLLSRILIQFGDTSQLDIEFDKINKDIHINSPEEDALLPESTNLKESVAGSIDEVSVEDTGLIEEDVSIDDQDGDGLSNNLETFYGSDPNNPDSDGDGYSDGDEVNNGYSPTGNGNLFNFGLPTL